MTLNSLIHAMVFNPAKQGPDINSVSTDSVSLEQLIEGTSRIQVQASIILTKRIE